MSDDTIDAVWYQENDLAGQGGHLEYWTKRTPGDFTFLAYAPENRLLWGVECAAEAVDALNRRRGIPDFLTAYAAMHSNGSVSELPCVVPKSNPKGDYSEYVVRLEEAVRLCPEPVFLLFDAAFRLVYEILGSVPGGIYDVALSPSLVLRCNNGMRDLSVELTDAAALWLTQRKKAEARERRRAKQIRKTDTRLAAVRECGESVKVYRAVSRVIDGMLPEGITLPSPVYDSTWPTYVHCPWGEQMRVLYYALVWKDPLHIRNRVLQALEPVERVWKTCRYWGENCQRLGTNMLLYAGKRGKRVGQLFSVSLIDAVETSRKYPFTFPEDQVTAADRKRLARQRRRMQDGNHTEP